jgi:hypothetical protein
VPGEQGACQGRGGRGSLEGSSLLAEAAYRVGDVSREASGIRLPAPSTLPAAERGFCREIVCPSFYLGR